MQFLTDASSVLRTIIIIHRRYIMFLFLSDLFLPFVSLSFIPLLRFLSHFFMHLSYSSYFCMHVSYYFSPVHTFIILISPTSLCIFLLSPISTITFLINNFLGYLPLVYFSIVLVYNLRKHQRQIIAICSPICILRIKLRCGARCSEGRNAFVVKQNTEKGLLFTKAFLPFARVCGFGCD